jgi:hypothetical protein
MCCHCQKVLQNRGGKSLKYEQGNLSGRELKQHMKIMPGSGKCGGEACFDNIFFYPLETPTP